LSTLPLNVPMRRVPFHQHQHDVVLDQSVGHPGDGKAAASPVERTRAGTESARVIGSAGPSAPAAPVIGRPGAWGAPRRIDAPDHAGTHLVPIRRDRRAPTHIRGLCDCCNRRGRMEPSGNHSAIKWINRHEKQIHAFTIPITRRLSRGRVCPINAIIKD
jgi:hypothetical protein